MPARRTPLSPPSLPPPTAPWPSARQLLWHEREIYGFLHFTVNTFTDKEWGYGDESPSTFDPTGFDAEQIVGAAKAAGMRGLILTAKHHDGFCLWPSRLTEHSVKNNRWREGKGDVVRESADACRRHGLAFCVYLSPWDRNHPTYGDSPAYNAVFAGQLEEVLTGYAPVFEVWWDGACGEGPNGRRQVYDWPRFTDVVRRSQPAEGEVRPGTPDRHHPGVRSEAAHREGQGVAKIEPGRMVAMC